MRRSIRSLKAGCKALKFILEETLGEGPELEEARTLLRSLFYVAKDAILAEDVDDYSTAEAKAFGDELVWDEHSTCDSPTIKGTLVTVRDIKTLLDDGWDSRGILRTHPELTEKDVEACVNYIAFSEAYYGEPIAA